MSPLKVSQHWEGILCYDALKEYKFQFLALCITVFLVGKLIIQVEE